MRGKVKKEMSRIILFLVTLVQIIPFCTSGSTTILEGFSSYCKAGITFTSLSTYLAEKQYLRLGNINSTIYISFKKKVSFYFYNLLNS